MDFREIKHIYTVANQEKFFKSRRCSGYTLRQPSVSRSTAESEIGQRRFFDRSANTISLHIREK